MLPFNLLAACMLLLRAGFCELITLFSAGVNALARLLVLVVSIIVRFYLVFLAAKIRIFAESGKFFFLLLKPGVQGFWGCGPGGRGSSISH